MRSLFDGPWASEAAKKWGPERDELSDLDLCTIESAEFTKSNSTSVANQAVNSKDSIVRRHFAPRHSEDVSTRRAAQMAVSDDALGSQPAVQSWGAAIQAQSQVRGPASGSLSCRGGRP